MYSKKVLDHFRNPRNVGKLKNPDATGKVGNIVCTLPTTQVHMNSGIKPINKINKQDKVFSHNGAFNSVKNVYKRKYKDRLIIIKNKLGKTFLTPDHLVYGVKVKSSHYYKYNRNKKKLTNNPQWIHAGDLKKGDILIYPIFSKIKDIEFIQTKFQKRKFDYKSFKIPKKIKINNAFMRLAGYYLSEGYITDKISRVRIGFVFNSKEKKYISDLQKCISSIFALKTKLDTQKPTATNIYVNSVGFARFFKSIFGKGASNKKIPSLLMSLPLDKQKHLIKGMWRGDGYFNLTRKWPRAGYTTISFLLAQQLKTLLLRQGIIPSIYEEEAKIKNGVSHKKAYRIHVGERDSLIKLAKILDIDYKNKKEIKVSSWIKDNNLYLPLTGVKTINYQGEVFNLEVEKSKSFTSTSSCLHNCGDVMYLYLKVAKKDDQEYIKDIKFKTFGCTAAIATTSIITEMAKGKSLSQAQDIKKSDVVDELGGLPPVKVHCSLLATDALSEAIYNYLRKTNQDIPKKLQKKHDRIKKERDLIEEKYQDWTQIQK